MQADSKSKAGELAVWKPIVAEYEKPSTWRALWQVVNTLGLYALAWYLMYHALDVSFFLALPLALFAGALLVRVFIIFHDCGHGSFFKSRTANDVLGFITGILTFTPYYQWRWDHALHHATSGDLDKRGTGDLWTLTVQEYLEASRWKRFAYRLARNPLVLFVVAPVFVLIIKQRFVTPGARRRERHSVYAMNTAIIASAAFMCVVFGFKAFLLLQLIAMGLAGSAGFWLFYVQHQFEDVYWARGEEWDYTAAALKGSSFYKLPRVLQWFTGNIGYHHIHHLSPRIPNYNLERCHKAHLMFQGVKPVTLFSSFKAFTYRLWDEQQKKLVGFGHIRELQRQQRIQ